MLGADGTSNTACDWAEVNGLSPLELSQAERDLYVAMKPWVESFAGIPMVSCRFSVAGPDSPLLIGHPEQAMAWSCCFQPGLERQVVWVGRWLDKLRARPGGLAEVAMTLVHEQCHASVRLAAGARLLPWPWPPLVLNVFEAAAHILACASFLSARDNGEATPGEVSWTLASRSMIAASLFGQLSSHGATSLRIHQAVRLAVGMLAAQDDAGLAMACNSAFDRRLEWAEWTQELGFLGEPTPPL